MYFIPKLQNIIPFLMTYLLNVVKLCNFLVKCPLISISLVELDLNSARVFDTEFEWTFQNRNDFKVSSIRLMSSNIGCNKHAEILKNSILVVKNDRYSLCCVIDFNFLGWLFIRETFIFKLYYISIRWSGCKSRMAFTYYKVTTSGIFFLCRDFFFFRKYPDIDTRFSLKKLTKCDVYRYFSTEMDFVIGNN